jgi:tRNA nucleotidyltransferase (CCA-adding enzyme)
MPNLRHIWPKEAVTVANLLGGIGARTRLVGGPVRDTLMGIVPKDFDLCTDATPIQMLEAADGAGIRSVPTLLEVQADPGLWSRGGLKHGTVCFVLSGNLTEVTTLRRDVATNGRHAEVEFVTDFQTDAARRDFTMNAMSVDIDGTLFDYFNGVEDLRRGVIAFVGDADERIQEDYLRILRFFRFQARYGSERVPDSAERATMAAVVRNIDGLKRISGERMWLEMQRILVTGSGLRQLTRMAEIGVAAAIGLTGRFSDMTEAKAAVGRVSAPMMLGLVIGSDPIANSDKAVEQLQAKWRFGNEEAQAAEFSRSNMHLSSAPYSVFFDLAMEPKSRRDLISSLLTAFGRQEEAKRIVGPLPEFPITGSDLVSAGFTPGPDLGEALVSLRQAWRESGYVANAMELMEGLAVKERPSPGCR